MTRDDTEQLQRPTVTNAVIAVALRSLCAPSLLLCCHARRCRVAHPEISHADLYAVAACAAIEFLGQSIDRRAILFVVLRHFVEWRPMWILICAVPSALFFSASSARVQVDRACPLPSVARTT